MTSTQYQDYLSRTEGYRTSDDSSTNKVHRLMDQSMKGCRVAKFLLRGLVLRPRNPDQSYQDALKFVDHLADAYSRGGITEDHFQRILDTVKEEDEEIERDKPKILDRFGQVLDMIYGDVKSPKPRLAKFPFAFRIPALIEPGDLENVLKERNTHLYGIGTSSYSQRFAPKLTEFLEVLEKHPIARESYPTGEVVSHFRDNIKVLDDLGDKLTDHRTYILVENARNGELTIIRRPDPHPAVTVGLYAPSESRERGFNVRMEVDPNNWGSIQIGKGFIVPYEMQPEGHKRDVDLVGYRLSQEEFKRGVIEDHDGHWFNYRLYSDPKEIWGIVKSQVSQNMYLAIREMVDVKKK